ncbi:MAG: hypothetical protein Q7J57_16180 [Gemmobacter sp.]|nr:hypothetical protein [Gemmobacter sp.]
MLWAVHALLGPSLWAILFAAVYALHGIGCARGWPAVDTGIGSLHIVVMSAVWLTGLALHIGLVLCAPSGRAHNERLVLLGAWIGLVASLVTLSPIIYATTCR